jgi:UDP-2-acetamido-3-amino-2,3-dideoxy-glucuronate N-acetyltransferase
MIDVGAFVHPKAHVEDGVTLGHGCKVWQFASVVRGARIGQRCSIASCAIVDGAEVGDDCLIGHGASIHPGSSLGAGVFIGPGVVLTNDVFPSVAKIGFDAQPLLSGKLVTVRIEDLASIGANATILPGVTIGAGAFVAAGAVVSRDLAAGHIWKRSGEVCEFHTGWAKRRMRAAA